MLLLSTRRFQVLSLEELAHAHFGLVVVGDYDGEVDSGDGGDAGLHRICSPL